MHGSGTSPEATDGLARKPCGRPDHGVSEPGILACFCVYLHIWAEKFVRKIEQMKPLLLWGRCRGANLPT